MPAVQSLAKHYRLVYK